LGCWGKIFASGAPNDFSRSSEMPIAHTHFPEEPFFLPSVKSEDQPEALWLRYRSKGPMCQEHMAECAVKRAWGIAACVGCRL